MRYFLSFNSILQMRNRPLKWCKLPMIALLDKVAQPSLPDCKVHVFLNRRDAVLENKVVSFSDLRRCVPERIHPLRIMEGLMLWMLY